MKRLIDLSVPTEASPSEPIPVKVSHEEHRLSVGVMKMFFGCTEVDLPEGLGWANDTVNMISHAGTHVDAPWHYSPTSEGKRARTIDEIPLEWFYSDGVVLDMRHKERGSGVSVDDLQKALGHCSDTNWRRQIVGKARILRSRMWYDQGFYHLVNREGRQGYGDRCLGMG